MSKDQTISIVTGACGGIGSAIVERLCARGDDVYAVSHRMEEIEAIGNRTGARGMFIDISDPVAVSEHLAGIEAGVVINAAAVLGETASYADTRPETAQRIMDVNVIGFSNLLRAVVPGMKERNCGHVVGFGSIAGHHVTSGQPMYSASKAAVGLMLSNLRLELFGTDIRVAEIMPGRVKTGMHAEMFSGDHAQADSLVYRDYECLSPGDVADAVLYMLNAPAHVDITRLEILPTHQVLGGARFHSRTQNDDGQEAWR
jgi:3-hydroxy acid dehydrogenase/malonic semialdehyde reductase